MQEVEFIDKSTMLLKTIEMMNATTETKNHIPTYLTACLTSIVALHNLVEVRESPIHGVGVFAKRDFLPDEVVTIFPCHGVLFDCGNIETTRANNDDDLVSWIHQYKIHLPSSSVYIFGNPRIKTDGLLGHFINDSEKNVQQLAEVTLDNTIRAFIEYTIRAIRFNNCAFVPTSHFVYVKTLKPIAQGEELLCSYGFDAWCKHIPYDDFIRVFTEHIEGCTETRKRILHNLVNQVTFVAPEPSNEFKEICLPMLTNRAFMAEMINGQMKL